MRQFNSFFTKMEEGVELSLDLRHLEQKSIDRQFRKDLQSIWFSVRSDGARRRMVGEAGKMIPFPDQVGGTYPSFGGSTKPGGAEAGEAAAAAA